MGGRAKRRIGLFLASGLVALTIVGLGRPAGAVTYGTTGDVINDPNDVSNPLDLQTVTRSGDTSTVTFSFQTYDAFMDSNVDLMGAFIDLEGDGKPEFLAAAAWNGSSLEGAVLDADGNVKGPATVTRTATTSLQLSFDRSLIGGATTFTWLAIAFNDVNGNGKPDAGEVDAAPNDVVLRIAGADRIDTSIKTSQDSFGNGEAHAAVLAKATDYPDALAGTPLAVAKDAPLLLTNPAGLDARVEAELQRVLTPTQTVYLLGGTAALSQAVEDRVRALGYTPLRLAGPDRFQTALQVADQGLGNPNTIFLATGATFPDALSAGAAAAHKDGAVLLTAGNSMPGSVAAYLATHPADQVFAIGGAAAAADPAATAIVGVDRYDTSRKVATTLFDNPLIVGIASGQNFPDGLSGGAEIGQADGPLLLSAPSALSGPTQDYLSANRDAIEVAVLYGGTAALSDAVEAAVHTAIT